jgi:hypothetical protein
VVNRELELRSRAQRVRFCYKYSGDLCVGVSMVRDGPDRSDTVGGG